MVSVSNYFSIKSVSFLEKDIQKLIEFIVSPKRIPKIQLDTVTDVYNKWFDILNDIVTLTVV